MESEGNGDMKSLFRNKGAYMKAYTLGLYEKAMPQTLTWKEKLEAAKAAGYDFVEISIDETDEKLARLDWSREERRELVDLMYQIGIPVRTMCLSGHRKYPIGSLPDMMFIMKSLLRKP